jgi:hypothetical protein
MLPDAAGAQQQVGTAAAVNPAAQARGTGGSRTIILGQSIAHRERIQTTAGGSVQLLFLDKTSMTIGPNSDLAIDEYVYDPNTNSGKMAATLTKGVMRFVGGQISHAGNAQVTTPNAVVGIRGGVGIFSPAMAFIGYGEGTVTSGSSTVTLGAGEYTQTEGGGAPPTPPAPPPPAFIASLVAIFQSAGGQGGGAAVSQGGVDSARTSATGSSTGNIATTSTAAANVTAQNATQAAAQGAVTQQVSQLTQSTQTATQQAIIEETATEIRAEVARIAAEQTAEEVRRRQFSETPFAFATTRCCTVNNQVSPVPYLHPDFAQNGNFYLSPIVGYRVASLDNPNRAAFFQYGINITGTGSSQNSWIFVNQGAFLDDGAGGLQSIAGIVGSRRGTAFMFPGFTNGSNSSIPGSLIYDVDNIPASGGTNQAYWVPESRQFSTVFNTVNFDLGNGTNGTYSYDQQFVRIPVPTGLGQNRPAEFLSGYVGGMVRTFNNSANQFTSLARPLFGAMTLGFDPTSSRLQANMFLSASETGTNGYQSGAYQFGSLDQTQRARSAYVDYDNFAATANRTVINTTTGEQIPGPGVQVNEQAPNFQAGLFVNVPRAVAQQITSGLGQNNITFCECEFTRWGFWSSTTSRTQNGQNVTDRTHLGTWVAGRLPDQGEVPLTGTATYVGHVVASVRNQNAEYVAGGNLSNSINFGTRTGTATVTGLDGTNYSGSLSAQSDPRFYNGALAGNVGGRNMFMFGNLYRGSASPVGEMGGQVTVSGTNYQASGIFAGRRQ